ncbi:unnamed protein product [Hydatigera taeniaeformis]|uniref:SCP domain-containing protein n=1 Tax=Hydatigena taeniaeformis TaxID=6205 RepID=A0A0R3WLM2_HYDTA|nr:unnamed protein product [Hydatigera taeniaeformis]
MGFVGGRRAFGQYRFYLKVVSPNPPRDGRDSIPHHTSGLHGRWRSKELANCRHILGRPSVHHYLLVLQSVVGVLVTVCSLTVLLSASIVCPLPTDVERAQMLEAHLVVREKVYPPASNMLLMEYSSELEALADRWASRCKFEHPDDRYYPEYKGLGQNIALVGGAKPSFTEAVCGWKDEVKDYDYFSGTCNGVCGHYTQMVWASSNLVGCAMRQCDYMEPSWSNPQYFTVCQYKPAGNIYGEKPYEYGASCSKCPDGYSCFRNQCIKRPTCKNVQPTMRLKKPEDRVLPECKVFTK